MVDMMRRSGLALIGGAMMCWSGAALAQATAPIPPAPPEIVKPDATPNAITPPGGIARGVIEPPHSVDPGMVTPPPPTTTPTMPVIKPPGTSR